MGLRFGFTTKKKVSNAREFTKVESQLSSAKFSRNKLSFEPLEPRLLLSADAFGGIVDADDIATPVASFSALDKIRDDLNSKLQSNDLIALKSNHNDSSNYSSPYKNDALPSPHLNLGDINQVFAVETNTHTNESFQLIFIDASVENANQLIDGVDPTTAHIFTLSSDQPALQQITDIINDYSNISSIHLIGHGSEGSMQLGISQLDQAALENIDNQSLIKSWQEHTTHSADLMLYGCDFASGQMGQSAANLLAQLSGMDVAASTNLTGSSAAGADWNLEYTTGVVESLVIVSEQQQTQWQNTLATIVVNTAEDQSLSFGINSVDALINNETEISLREAISAINNEFVFGGSPTQHTIEFNLQGDQSINLLTSLPTIQRSVIIDATSDPDYADIPVIQIIGTGNVLSVAADGVEIRGLEISGGNYGIVLSGDDSVIVGNYIHDHALSGISISGNNNTIGGGDAESRNIISGNGENGIKISGSNADFNAITGNYIGTNADGSSANGNGLSGIYISNGSSNSTISNNVISGNAEHGIHIEGSTSFSQTNEQILGNIIGLDSSGSSAIANELHGIFVVDSNDVAIGDGTEAGRNIVSGNVQHGIQIHLESRDINIQGNFIGTDISGTQAIGNGYNGVEIYGAPEAGWVFGGSSNDLYGRVLVGGNAAGQGNLISGNFGDGVTVDADAIGVNIFGNYIGTDITGTLALGNQANGITVKAGLDSSTSVAAQTDIQNNIIAFNTQNGIEVQNNSTQVWIIENAIFDNGELGIDLNGDGFTANDTADVDSGANGLFNFPELNLVDIVNSQLRISGSLDYSSFNSGEITIHFYYADHENDNGSANAQTYIGEYYFTTNFSGQQNFDELFDIEIPAGSYITATATSTGGSSEFAPSQFLAQGNIPNQSPSGDVSISGELIQGAVLTAVSTLSDPNGISSSLQYQWRRNGTAIEGANQNTYELQESDVATQISVAVSYVDDDGYEESTLSNNTDPIANLNDPASGEATISGNRTEDQVLSAVYNIEDEDGVPGGVNIQWYRDGEAIVDANGNTYTLGDADVGASINYLITFTDLRGTEESITSTATSAIANINDAPTGSVSISGTPAEDSLLNAAVSVEDADGLPATFNYQWYRDGNAINGATNSSYQLSDDDVGATIHFTLTYQDLQGATEVLTSPDSGIVNNTNDAPIGTLEILGSNVEGNTLAAQVNFTDTDGISNPMNYQWYRDGIVIAGANAVDYLITNADVGSALSVTATYQDDYGQVETVESSPTNAVNNTNQTPTGTVTIQGAARENQVLSVNIDLSDPDGLPAEFQYLWYRDNVAIIGADQQQYTLTDDDVGSSLSVEISYTDNLGSHESVLSNATAIVSNINDAPTGNVSIVGSNQEGQTLSTQINVNDDDGLPNDFVYQWLRNGEAIDGATGTTYTLTGNDVGAQITFSLSYIDLQGGNENVISNPFGPIVNVNQTPTGALSIEGTVQEDSRLTLVNNFEDADGLPTNFNYQWYRDGAALSGANSNSYLLTEADVGSIITASVTYVDSQGSEEYILSAATNEVANINDSPTGGITIQGGSAEGQTLTLANYVADADGIGTTLGYQWYRDGEAITGATNNSYLISADDIGADLHVTWRYLDGHGTMESVQSQTISNIQNVNASPVGAVTISGAALENTLLQVSNTITDDDGISGTINYQWYRDGALIEGATGATLQLEDSDAGSSFLVIARYVDDFGQHESVASQGFGPIANVNDAPTGAVTITGLAQENQTLMASNSIVDVDGISEDIQYQWFRNGIAIADANSDTLLLGDLDVGAQISVRASYTDDFGTLETVESEPTIAVLGLNDSPTGDVLVSGNLLEDSTLTASHSLDDPDGMSGPVSYQWFRDGTQIVGANSSDYTLGDDDVGTRIHVVASYIDDAGNNEAVASGATSPVINVNDSPLGSININGEAFEDQTLNAGLSLTDADGLPAVLNYQWFRDGAAIAGANSEQYTLTAQDVNAQITLEVSYTDNQGSNETVLSSATESVIAVNHTAQGSISISGPASIGETISASSEIVDQDGVDTATLSYQWLRDGEAIEGATSSDYTLTARDVGRDLTVQVSFVDARGFEESVLSGIFKLEPTVVVEIAAEELEISIPETVDSEAITPETSNQTALDEEIEPSEDQQSQVRDATQSNTNEANFLEPKRTHQSAGFLAQGDRFASGGSNLGIAINSAESLDTNNSPVLSASNDFAFSALQIYKESGVTLDIGAQSLNRMINILNNRDYSDRVENSVNNMEDKSIRISGAIIGGTTAVSTGLSLGYLAWTLRSGILMTSLLSSLPAWRFIDPLPILESQRNLNNDDDESLESMVAGSHDDDLSGESKHV